MKKTSKDNSGGNMGLVFCINPDQYDIFDERINKPVCIKKIEDGMEVGSMVLQDMDKINFRRNNLEYFPPNNVGILLSISRKYLEEAKSLFDNKLDPIKFDHSMTNTEENKKQFLIEKSKVVCDYIELIQISIVFSYTALEAFCNLSIPDNYVYKSEVKSKGIYELYDKPAIERWVPLQEKLSKILIDVYLFFEAGTTPA